MEQVSISKHNRIQKKPLYISKRYEEIMRAILLHRALTAEQVVRLFFKSGSLTYVRHHLFELAHKDNKYLSRVLLPHVKPGSSPYLYSLGTRGISYLSDRDMYIPGYKAFTSANYNIDQHFLTINDFAIAARLLPTLTPDVTLTSFLHEWQLKKHPVTALIDNKEISREPDLWLDFQVLAGSKKTPLPMPIWVEIDRGSGWGKKFKDKLRDIVLLITERAWQTRFGVKHITVAFATSGTEKRRDLMRIHMKTVLEELGKERFSHVFLFANLPQDADPKTIFLSPLWYTPTSDIPLSLLDMSD